MESKKIISKKKGFFELLLVTDGQGYMIDRYWERGGIFVLLLFILSVLPYSSKAQMSSDSLVQKIAGYIDAIQNFGDVLPQEKVYLHFDNTSYYQGDPIWFQCYVVTPGLNHLQSPNQKIPDRKTKCVIKTHINIKQNVIFSAKLKPV